MSATPQMKLSVCIPTLNREDLIGETLASIVPQLTDEVEIIIVDGGSTDATQRVVAGFQQRYPSIRYFREQPTSASTPASPSCAGFDHDCDRAVELASGEYCWLFTDDDLFKAGAVQTVLRAAEKHFQAIIVNAEVRSEDFSQLLQASRLRHTSDRVYTEAQSERFFVDVIDYLSFLGGVVVKRQFWLDSQRQSYFGSGLIHLGVLFHKPIPGQVIVLAEPLISIRYGNALYMRSSRYFEIWMFLWPRMIWSFPHLSKAAKQGVCREEPWRRFRMLLLFRALGAYSRREYVNWLDKRMSSWWEKFIARLAASFPGTAANLLFVIKYHLFPGKPRQALVDLMKSPFYFARTAQGNLSTNVRVLQKS